MRSEGQIRHQLRQVTFRHLQKRLRENFRQRPGNCTFNRDVLLDGQTRGFCGYQEDGEPRMVLCDSRFTGCVDMARTCPLWQPVRTKEDIKQEFLRLLQGDRGLLAAQYPDIAALMWVLDSAGEPLTAAEIREATEPAAEQQFFLAVPQPESGPTPEAPEEPTFWTRLWNRGGHRK